MRKRSKKHKTRTTSSSSSTNRVLGEASDVILELAKELKRYVREENPSVIHQRGGMDG